MKHYDVVVIGAGLAGLYCAGELSRRGMRVLLVDRKSSVSAAVHTTGIFVRRTFEDFKLPEDCLGPPIRHVSLYSPARRALHLESPRDEFRVGRMADLYERYLEQAREGGADWVPGARYLGSRPVAGGLQIDLEHAGECSSVHARFVIGADGANSRVAVDLGLDTNRRWLLGVEEVYEDVPLTGPPRLDCFLDPRIAPGYLAWVVNDGQTLHIGLAGHARRFDPRACLEKFRADIQKTIPLKKGRLMERRGGRIPIGGLLRRLVNDRGLLVGDAAGAVSPLTAGGLDPALRLSRLAVQVIAEYLATGRADALASYDGARIRRRFRARLLLRRILSAASHPWILEAACAVLRIGPLRPIAEQIFFGRGSFPDVTSDTAEYDPPLEASRQLGHVIGCGNSVLGPVQESVVKQ